MSHNSNSKIQLCITFLKKRIVSSFIIASSILIMQSVVPLQAKSLQDTLVVPGIVVTASRIPLLESAVPAAVSILDITSEDWSQTGASASIVTKLLGHRAYSVGNLWGTFHTDTRGFYGAGEAQYSRVMLDGIPLNRSSTGVVNWTAVNLISTDRIESLNGPSSVEWGDYAFGGVLAISSPPSASTPSAMLSLTSASYDGFAGSGTVELPLSNGSFSGAISTRKNNGWREHSKLERHQISTRYRNTNDDHDLSILFAFGRSAEEIPGALTPDELSMNRSMAASPMTGGNRLDKTKSKQMLVGLKLESRIGSGFILTHRLSSSFTDEFERRTITSTLDHDTEDKSIEFETSARKSFDATIPVTILIGASTEFSQLSSFYKDFITENKIKNGDAKRSIIAIYASTIFDLNKKFAVSLGTRVERIKNDYESLLENIPSAEQNLTTKNTSIHPKFTLSYHPDIKLGFYSSISRTFKAPTLGHLYDSQPIYYFGTYIDVGNSNLEPMTGTNLEIGTKFFDLAGLSGQISLYDYRLKNEIDFDNATNSYANIGKSRHLGFEIDVRRTDFEKLQSRVMINYNETTFETGEHEGNQLNGVPKLNYSASLTLQTEWDVDMSLIATGIKDIWVDQANSLKITDWVEYVLSASTNFKQFSLTARIDNLFDLEHEYNGYFDPFVQSARYYPAPGRNISVSIISNIF